MNIEGMETQIRAAIAKRRGEGIAIRNTAMARSLGNYELAGGYWNSTKPEGALCILGIFGGSDPERSAPIDGVPQAALALGISEQRASLLEAGFEGWINCDVGSSLWILGRKIGQELEDQLQLDRVQEEQALKEG